MTTYRLCWVIFETFSVNDHQRCVVISAKHAMTFKVWKNETIHWLIIALSQNRRHTMLIFPTVWFLSLCVCSGWCYRGGNAVFALWSWWFDEVALFFSFYLYYPLFFKKKKQRSDYTEKVMMVNATLKPRFVFFFFTSPLIISQSFPTNTFFL